MSDVRFQIFLKSRKSMLISYGIRHVVKRICAVRLILHLVFRIMSYEFDLVDSLSDILLIFLLAEALSLQDQMSIPVCKIVGHERAGKTTLMTSLIQYFSKT